MYYNSWYLSVYSAIASSSNGEKQKYSASRVIEEKLQENAE